MRIAVLSLGTVERDSLAAKTAQTLYSAGYDVTLVGRGAATEAGSVTVGSVPAFLLPGDGLYSRFAGGPKATRARARARSDEAARRARMARLELAGPHYARAMVRVAGRYKDLWQAAPAFREAAAVVAPVIDDLAPDVIHAVGVDAAAVADLALRGGRLRPDVVCAVTALTSEDPRVSPAARRLAASAENHLLPRSARLLPISDRLLASLRRRHESAGAPIVVRDAPVAPDTDHVTRSIRRRLGLGPGIPLLIMAGPLTRGSGINTVLEAVALSHALHCALLVSAPDAPDLQDVLNRAAKLGISHRIHVCAMPLPGQFAHQVGSATAAVLPTVRAPANEGARLGLFMSFVSSGLPVVVSDAAELKEEVTSSHVGAVFRRQDARSLLDAAEAVISDVDGYRPSSGVREEFSWAGQEEALLDVYGDLTRQRTASGGPAKIEPPVEAHNNNNSSSRAHVAERASGARGPAEPRLLIGPANMAGQGWAWAKAVERGIPGSDTTVVTLRRDDEAIAFPTDLRIDSHVVTRTELEESAAALSRDHTHVLSESGLGPLALRRGSNAALATYQLLESAGTQVALVFHGSELRSPRNHMDRYSDSVFHDLPPNEVRALQERSDYTRLLARMAGLPIFVSTPDLLEELPAATLLPLTIDVDRCAMDGAQRELVSQDRPVVLHAPGYSTLSSSATSDEVLRDLDAEGVIHYRRLGPTPPDQFTAALAEADIIVDKLQIGYGVTACQAMATGRAVVGWLGPEGRDHVPDLPVVNAKRSNLRDVVVDLAKDHDRIRHLGAEGQRFTAALHDGRAAVAALTPFLTGDS